MIATPENQRRAWILAQLRAAVAQLEHALDTVDIDDHLTVREIVAAFGDLHAASRELAGDSKVAIQNLSMLDGWFLSGADRSVSLRWRDGRPCVQLMATDEHKRFPADLPEAARVAAAEWAVSEAEQEADRLKREP